jgi:hypothetical protein
MDVRGQTPTLFLVAFHLRGAGRAFAARPARPGEPFGHHAQHGATVTSAGLTSMDLRRNLNGRVDFRVTDGALQGVNVAQLLRDGIRKVKGQAPGAQEAPQTVFPNLSASGNIIRESKRRPIFYCWPRAFASPAAVRPTWCEKSWTSIFSSPLKAARDSSRKPPSA